MDEIAELLELLKSEENERQEEVQTLESTVQALEGERSTLLEERDHLRGSSWAAEESEYGSEIVEAIHREKNVAKLCESSHLPP